MDKQLLALVDVILRRRRYGHSIEKIAKETKINRELVVKVIRREIV